MPPADPRPTLTVVSGRPGSGKTTLARALVEALACPLLSRDEVNEGVFQTYDRAGLAKKEVVAELSFRAFCLTLEALVVGGVTFIAEAAFQDEPWRIGLEPLVNRANIKIVHCAVDPELAVLRVARRTEQEASRERREEPGSDRRTGEVSTSSTRPFKALSLDVPSISVLTADGYDPGLNEILAFISA